MPNVVCRYVHSECDEGVEQNKSKPEEYVCLACKNRDMLPVCKIYLIWLPVRSDTVREMLYNLQSFSAVVDPAVFVVP